MKVDSKLYDLLVELARLDRQDLEGRFSKNNVDSLRKLSGEILGDENFFNIKSPSEFAESVKELHKANWIWSRRLGDAINLAGESYERGDLQAAIGVFDAFVKDCPSPFLKEVAMDSKAAYKAGKIRKRSEAEKTWGRRAGNVLADAFECEDRGDNKAAIDMLDAFIKVCPIERYKESAQNVKADIAKKT